MGMHGLEKGLIEMETQAQKKLKKGEGNKMPKILVLDLERISGCRPTLR